MLKAIIFDLDGVLIDATEWHYEALNKALNLFGYEIKREDHLSVYNGLPTTEKLKILSEKEGLPTELHEVIKRMKRIYTDEKVDQLCRPSYDKQVMLTHLKRKGYRLACSSNAQKYSVINMLKRAQIDQFFEVIIGNDEGFKPKPDPAIYLATFEKLGISAQEAVIVEDAPHGIQAARASGAKVIEVKGFEEVNLSLFEKLDSDSGFEKYRLENYIGGWFIGNFDPSLLKANDFEVGVKSYKVGDKDPKHYHKVAKEYTVILEGRFRMNSEIVSKGDIIYIEPNKKTDFECLVDGSRLAVKIPCVKGDKYLFEDGKAN